MLVELDAQDVGSLGGDDRVGVMDRLAGLISHQRHPGRGAADRRQAGKIVALHRLLQIVEAMVPQGVQAL